MKNEIATATEKEQMYAIEYNGMFHGKINHEHRTSKIEEAMAYTKTEMLNFLRNVPGAKAVPIP